MGGLGEHALHENSSLQKFHELLSLHGRGKETLGLCEHENVPILFVEVGGESSLAHVRRTAHLL